MSWVASLFVSRWDKAVNERVPAELRNRLGIAIGARTYQAYRQLLLAPRWPSFRGRRTAAAAASASTGVKDPAAPDTLYVEALAAPETIETMPEKTLHAFAEHGRLKGPMPEGGGDAESTLQLFARAGVNIDALATQLQQEGAQSS